VNEFQELARITDKKHVLLPTKSRSPSFGLGLQRKASRPAFGVGGPESARHHQEARDQVGLLADL
jgi:hypothetical protein